MNVSTSWPTPQLPRHEMTDNFSYIGIVPKITSIREKNYTAWIAAFLSSAMQISSSTEEKTFFLSSFLSSKEIDDLPSPFFFLAEMLSDIHSMTVMAICTWKIDDSSSSYLKVRWVSHWIFGKWRGRSSIYEKNRFTKKSWDVSTILRMLRKFCRKQTSAFLASHSPEKNLSILTIPPLFSSINCSSSRPIPSSKKNQGRNSHDPRINDHHWRIPYVYVRRTGGERDRERDRERGWEQTRSGTAYLFDLLAALISHVIQGWIRRFNDVGPGDGDRRWSDRGWLRLSLPRVHPSILIFEGFRLVLARDHVTLHPCGVRLLLVAALLGRPSTLHHVREITTRDERAGEKDDQYHGQESADRQPLHQPHLVQALAALPQAARSCRCFARIGGAVRGTRYMYTWCGCVGV